MADYKVGNLQIVFDTLNQTDEGFKKLASNLRSVQKAIAKIGDTDLKPFVANMKQVVKSFSPLLTNISGASDSIIALNQAIQKIGASKLSKVTQEFNKFSKQPEEGSDKVNDFTAAIKETEEILEQFSSKSTKSFTDLNQELLAQQQYLKQLNRAYAIAFSKNRQNDMNAYGTKIIETKQAIQGLKDKIKNFGKEVSLAAKAVEEVGQEIFTPFNDAQKEVAKLTNELLNLTYASGQVDSGIANSIRELNSQINTTQEAVKKATMSEEELTIYEYRNVEATRKQRIEFLQASLALGKAGANAEAYKQELAELTNEQENNNKATKKGTSGFRKFLKSLGRIALYRTIRRAIQLVTQAFTETIKAFAEVDDSVNSTMSNITSSLSVIRLSFGSLIIPLLQMVEPIIQQISVAFANFANLVGQAMSTTGKYTEINANYWADYREQLEKTKGSLLDFDKFRSLSNSATPSLSDALIPNQDVDETNEKVIALRETIQRITSIISNLWEIIKSGWNDIKPFVLTALDILDDFVLPALKKMFDAVGKITKKINELGLTKHILYGIIALLAGLGAVKIVTSISKLTASLSKLNVGIGAVGIAAFGLFAIIEKWGDMSLWQKIIGIIGVATTAVLGLAMAFGAFHSAWSLGLAATGIIAGISMIVASVAGVKKDIKSNAISYMADGGIPTAGTLFYAGEAGAETVTVGNSGRTEVTNVSQMEEALYNALVRYSRTSSGGGSQPININIDGQRLFEVTRRTANKRGLDFSKV